MTRGGEGGKKCPNLDDVICERPLTETCVVAASEGKARYTSVKAAQQTTVVHSKTPLRPIL